jgi:hypothetical protein
MNNPEETAKAYVDIGGKSVADEHLCVLRKMKTAYVDRQADIINTGYRFPVPVRRSQDHPQ